MAGLETFDAVVVGGGPSGATAAADLARAGRRTLLLDRAGRMKPCGGAIPPRAIDEFAIPEGALVSKVTSARIVSPKDKRVDMPIEDGFVGMVDREHFDEWLRVRAAANGAERRAGSFHDITRDEDGTALVSFTPKGADRRGEARETVRARTVIGADGANSGVARRAVPSSRETRFVFAYHEIIASPDNASADFAPGSCDVVYDGELSPDFYSWVFPHGNTTSVGTGTAYKGFSMRDAVARLRDRLGMADCETIRCEGAPIPLEPLKRWDNGRDVILAGDAAGCVAPASGEGIFYAMTGGRLAAQSVDTLLKSGDARDLAQARRRFMRAHGAVFWMLGMMQRYWYTTDARRERFVTICRDIDVQRLTWDAYMNKELVKAQPLAHVRIFFKNIAHLSGIVPA